MFDDLGRLRAFDGRLQSDVMAALMAGIFGPVLAAAAISDRRLVMALFHRPSPIMVGGLRAFDGRLKNDLMVAEMAGNFDLVLAAGLILIAACRWLFSAGIFFFSPVFSHYRRRAESV